MLAVLVVDFGFVLWPLVALYLVLARRLLLSRVLLYSLFVVVLLCVVGWYYGGSYFGVLAPFVVAGLLVWRLGWSVGFYSALLFSYAYGLTLTGGAVSLYQSLGLGLVYAGFTLLFSVALHAASAGREERRVSWWHICSVIIAGLLYAGAFVLFILSTVLYITRLPDYRLFYGFPFVASVLLVDSYAGVLAALVYLVVSGMFVGLVVGVAALASVVLVLLLYYLGRLEPLFGRVGLRSLLYGAVWGLVVPFLVLSPVGRLEALAIITGLAIYNLNPLIYFNVFGRLGLAAGVLGAEFLAVVLLWPYLGQYGFLVAAGLLAVVAGVKRVGIRRATPFFVAGVLAIASYLVMMHGAVSLETSMATVLPGVSTVLDSSNCTLVLDSVSLSGGWVHLSYRLQGCSASFALSVSGVEYVSEPSTGYRFDGRGCLYVIEPYPSPSQRAEVQLWLMTGREPRLADAPVDIVYREACGLNWVSAIPVLLAVTTLLAYAGPRLASRITVVKPLWRLKRR